MRKETIMSIIKKYSKTFIGLSALGLGAVSPVAHADTQVESYPDVLHNSFLKRNH